MESLITRRAILQPPILEAICQTIAGTDGGLTGTEIGKILRDCGIKDTDPSITKWKRLYNAFIGWQNEYQCSNHILKFIQEALRPVRYIGREELFQTRRHEINKRLAFIGIELANTGLLRNVAASKTITEAEQRASHFKYKLENRNIHSEILKYCSPELLMENYFHSVFEGVKSIADRLRNMTNLHADGNALAETAFSTSTPLVRINNLITDTDRSEHLGLCNMIKGLFGLIRNPTSHAPKIKLIIEEEEALDVMTTISYVHKLLDKAK